MFCIKLFVLVDIPVRKKERESLMSDLDDEDLITCLDEIELSGRFIVLNSIFSFLFVLVTACYS